ncbi:MAG: SRPBCC domain-containing protein [Phycisphaerales bacterium]|nr:SRPBCC domain-containing protein [Phycisphaerales bacterium]
MTLNANTPTEFSIRVSKFIRASRERVFEAWVRPEIRRKWWRTNRGEGPTTCEIDGRVGGKYLLKQIGSGAETPAGVEDDYEWVIEGEFLEFDAPRRLVFTWNVNHPGEPSGDERVTIEFHEAEGGTEVTISHEGILSSSLRDGTEKGWTKLLELQAEVLAQA